MTVVAVAAEEPAGKAVAACAMRNVSLSLHRGAEDDQLLSEQGPLGFRRQRIPELCQQALSQGALLTREDLAWLRQNDPRPLPLRRTVHDIGPLLSHRVQVVRLALEGKTTTQICEILRHSSEAVANYLGPFRRCAQLARRGFEVGQIAFVLRRGRGLIERYLELAG